MNNIPGISELLITKHAWDVYEHRNGAPLRTSPILEGGHVAFHFSSSIFEDGPHALRVLDNQDLSQHTRNLIELHQALVYTANEMIRESARKIAACPFSFEDVEPGSGVDGMGEDLKMDLIRAYNQQVKAGAGTGRKGGNKPPRKRSRNHEEAEEAEDEDVMTPEIKRFAQEMLRAKAWSSVEVQNYFVGEIQSNCEVSDTKGTEIGGKRLLRSEVWITNLCYPDGKLPPNSFMVNWDQVLREIISGNCKRLEQELKDGKQNKYRPVVYGPKKYDKLAHVYSGYQFIEEFILPMIAHEDMHTAHVIMDSRFIDRFNRDNGQLDPMIGTWTPEMRLLHPEITLDQVFSFMNILRWRDPVSNNLPPMYRQQLSDDSLYLRPYLETLGIDTTDRECVKGACESRVPYVNGFSFEELYEQCPKLKRSIFIVDPKNTRSPTWRVERPSFSWWWSVALPDDQAAEVAGCGIFVPSKSGLRSHLMKADHESGVPFHKDMLTATVPTDSDDPYSINLVRHAPVEQLKEKGGQSMLLFKQAVKSLRDGNLPADDFVPLHLLQLQQARVLMDLIPNMAQAAESTKSIMKKLKEDGFVYRREGEGKSYELLAADFEGGCQYIQHMSIYLEFLGISTLHGFFHLLQTANISGCWPKSGLRFNVGAHGVPASGKSHVGILLIMLSIINTIVEHQVDTDCAGANENEKPLYHCTVYHHEIPNGFLVDRKDKGGAGSKAENIIKVQMTEHTVITRTNGVESGHRFTIMVTRPHHATMIAMSNTKSKDDFSDAIASRSVIVNVPMSERVGHSIADYSAWDVATDLTSTDAAQMRAEHMVQLVQAFTAQIGTLIYSGVLPMPNVMAFALIHKHVGTYLAKKGRSISGRDNIKARELAMSMMFRRICYDQCMQPHAPYSGQFDLRDQFDRHQRIASMLVITESEAIKSMVYTVAAFGETEVRRMAVAIMYMIAQEGKSKDSYSEYFVTRSHRASSKQFKGKNAEPEEEEEGIGEIELTMVRIKVGKTSDSLTSWCGDLCKIMHQIYGCTMSKDQVRDTLNMIADPQGPWKSTKHKPMNMNIPCAPNSLDTVEHTGEWTVRSIQEYARSRGMPPGPARSDIDLAGAAWRKDHTYLKGKQNSVYFPYEIQGSDEMNITTTCDLSHYTFTGYITFSSCFLTRESGTEIGVNPELMDAVCTTNTTPRGIIPVVITNTVTYGTVLPYVHPTTMLYTHLTRESVVPNPNHADKGLWETVMGADSALSEGRCNSELVVPSFVPLDAYTSYIRVRDLAEVDPFMTPDVYNLLPWSCIASIICPGILDLLERADDDFRAVYPQRGPERDKIIIHSVRRYLKHNMDLVSHCITDDNGVHKMIDKSARAKEKAKRQMKCLAHRVCMLSKSKGMGRMREASMNMPDEEEVLRAIRHLKYALKNPGGEYDYSNPDDSAFQNLGCLPAATLKSRLRRQIEKLQDIRKLRTECKKHSASDDSFTSYLEQYRKKIENGEIVHHHLYGPFLKWIRAKAKELQKKQELREAKWRK